MPPPRDRRSRWRAAEEEAAWQEHVERTLYPKLRESRVFLSIAPTGQPDAKFCLELGAAVMLDKPVLVVAPPGTSVPAGLRRIAHAVLEGVDPATEAGREVFERFIAEHVPTDAQDRR